MRRQRATIAENLLPERENGLRRVVGHVERGGIARRNALPIVDVQKKRIGQRILLVLWR